MHILGEVIICDGCDGENGGNMGGECVVSIGCKMVLTMAVVGGGNGDR